MDWIEQQLVNAPRPNTITHLGAGLCSELETYLRHRPVGIFLIEPNPEVLLALKRRTVDHDTVKVLPVAVSDREGRRALKLYNYSDMASLRHPTGLFQLLPGLRQTEQAVIDVIAAEMLPKQLNMDSEKNNWLVIDAPGEEFAIIESLTTHKQLHQFDRIILRAGAESFYEGAYGAKDIADYLQRLGYFSEGSTDNTDTDWPRIHLRLNPKALECRHLKRENEKLRRQFEEFKQKCAEDQAALTGQIENSKKQVDEHKSQSEKQLTSLQTENKQLEKRAESQKTELQKRIEEGHRLKIRASELEEENEDYKERHKLLEEELIKAEAQIDLIKQMFLSDDDSLDFEVELDKD